MQVNQVNNVKKAQRDIKAQTDHMTKWGYASICFLLVIGLFDLPLYAQDNVQDMVQNNANAQDNVQDKVQDNAQDNVQIQVKNQNTMPTQLSGDLAKPLTDYLNPVFVQSQIDKQSAPLVTAPGSIAKKSRDQILERVTPDLKGILSFEPNVDFIGGPRSSAELPQIRGLSTDRILILDEGVRQNFQSGHNGRVFTDFSIMENVEVVKGPWSALYGSGAIGGVISYTKATAADYIQRSGKSTGAEIAINQFGESNELGLRVTGFTQIGQWQPLVSYRSSQSADLKLSNGETLDYSAAHEKDAYISLGYQYSKDHKFVIKWNERFEIGDIPINPQMEAGALSTVADTQHYKQDFILDYTLKVGSREYRFKPYYRQTQVTQIRKTDGRKDERRVETVGLDSWVNHGISLSGDWSLVTTYGVDAFLDRNTGVRNGAGLSSFPNARSAESGVYIQPTFKYNNKLSFIPGVRWDQFSRTPDNSSLKTTDGQKETYKFYVNYEYQSEKTIFIGWGQAFHAPRIQDLYVNGMHFPGNFFVSNPELKPESAYTTELGSKSRYHLSQSQMLDVSATLFQTQAEDFIAQQIDMAGGTTSFANYDRVKLEGFEFSTQWMIDLWMLGASYGEVRSRNLVTDEPLADTSADQWSFMIHQYPTDHFKWGFDMKWTETQNLVPEGATQTPEYFLADAFTGYQTQSYGTWQLRVNNLFDRSYRPHVSQVSGPARGVHLMWSQIF